MDEKKKVAASEVKAKTQELAQEVITQKVQEYPELLIYVEVVVGVITAEEYAAVLNAASQPAGPARAGLETELAEPLSCP